MLSAVTLETYALERCLFDDCGNVPVGAVMGLTFADRSTAHVDLLIFKVAEVMHHALARAVTTEAFAALPREPRLRFMVEQYDRFPVLAYDWP